MPTEEQIKKVKKYGLLIQLPAAAFIMCFVPMGIFLFFEIIIGVSYSDTNINIIIGMSMVMVFMFLYLFIFVYVLVRIAFGMKKPDWQDLLYEKDIHQIDNLNSSELAYAKLQMRAGSMMQNSSNESAAQRGQSLQIIGGIKTVVITLNMINVMKQNIKIVADYHNIQIPSAKKYVMAIILIPIIALFGFYIPRVVQCDLAAKAELENAIAVQQEVVEVFETYFASTIYTVPKKISSLNCYVSGYTKNETQTTMSVGFDFDRNIMNVSYDMNLLPDKTKEENIEIFNSQIKELSKIVPEINFNINIANIEKFNELPQQAIDEFLNEKEDIDINVSQTTEDGNYRFAYDSNLDYPSIPPSFDYFIN